jgi:hypothetical protein
MEKLVREVQSENFRLKTDFKRLTDLLSSSVSKSIYQTFNDLRFTWYFHTLNSRSSQISQPIIVLFLY